MKHIKVYLSILLAVLFLVPATDGYAQGRKKPRKVNPNITHNIDVYGGVGYSSLLHKIPESTIPGGGAGMIGAGYFLKHKSGFNFRTGLEVMFLNSSTKMPNLSFDGDFNYKDPISNVDMIYHMNFDKYKEQQNRLSVGIPVMFGGQWSRYYFLVGAKVHLGVLGMYNTRSDLHTFATDPTLIDDLENMPNHTFQTSDVRYGSNLNFGIDVTGSAEFGISIDEWMPSKALTMKRGRARLPISYRVGVFADYGFMNINGNKHNNRFLAFEGMEDLGNGSFRVDAANLNKVQPNSLLAASEYAANSALNSLVVGAKFTVIFQVSPKPTPVKKKPRPRPRIKEVNTIPDPNFFYCMVSDFETEEPLMANIRLYNLDGAKDTVLSVATDSTGFFVKESKNMKVGIKVTCPGYIEYQDTLFQILSDTVYVDLQPIKKNTIVILNNLLFDTDKTVIRNISTQSLEDLYQLLTKNPELRIKVIGHTDNVGSTRYNMKLSKGRAKAVYDEMVRRGIDPDRMQWDGRGPLDPISDNDTPEGRAENRRVEFMIL